MARCEQISDFPSTESASERPDRTRFASSPVPGLSSIILLFPPSRFCIATDPRRTLRLPQRNLESLGYALPRGGRPPCSKRETKIYSGRIDVILPLKPSSKTHSPFNASTTVRRHFSAASQTLTNIGPGLANQSKTFIKDTLSSYSKDGSSFDGQCI